MIVSMSTYSLNPAKKVFSSPLQPDLRALGLTCSFTLPQKKQQSLRNRKKNSPRQTLFFHSFQTGLVLWENRVSRERYVNHMPTQQAGRYA